MLISSSVAIAWETWGPTTQVGPGGAVNTVTRGLTPDKEGLMAQTMPRCVDAVRQARRGTVQSVSKRRRIYERDGYSCRSCGKTFPIPIDARPAPSRDDYRDKRGRRRLCLLEIDHVQARRNGGTHADANLQSLCTQCNVRKAAK